MFFPAENLMPEIHDSILPWQTPCCIHSALLTVYTVVAIKSWIMSALTLVIAFTPAIWQNQIPTGGIDAHKRVRIHVIVDASERKGRIQWRRGVHQPWCEQWLHFKRPF